MNRQQWLEWRRGGLGSSDAPIIMGVSPWCTPYQLWERKITGCETEQTYAMQRGIEMEEPARKCFEQMLDIEVFPKNIEHPKYPWMRASLDGIDIDGKIVVEIKCPMKLDSHEQAKQGRVPDNYYPQLQHQLEVTGLDKMYYFSFDGNEGVIVEVKRDQAYIDELLLKEKEFWHCVETRMPPPLTERDWVDFSDDKTWVTVSEEWKSVNEQMKELEAKEEALRKLLIEKSNNMNAAGNGVKVSKMLVKGPIDYSKIPHIRDLDLDIYRKEPSVRWRIYK